jgi:hypothetical protein
VTPDELLALWIVRDARGRMVRTNEPPPNGRVPRLTMIRTATSCAWVLRADVDDVVAARVAAIAPADEPERYRELLGGAIDGGPIFAFPETLPSDPHDVVEIDSLAPLVRYLHGWNAEEIPERGPILAICDGADAISVCFCARRSATAAEAGVDTSASHRGRGHAARVTAAWATAIRASGRTPSYSTSWSNTASLAVARKLGLVQYATTLNIVDA